MPGGLHPRLNRPLATKTFEFSRSICDNKVMRSLPPPLPWLRWPIALWTTLLFAAFSESSSAQDSLELFEKQVRPLLLERCASCHGGQEPEGDLRLDQATGLAIGSRSGPVIVPGKPQESLLWLAVSGESPDLQMPPPPHKPLTHSQKRSIQQWLATGAALPVTAPSTETKENSSTDLANGPASDLWSLQPIELPGLPDAERAWSQQPIDRFVADRWPENHLPAAPADRSAWLRRVTIDLTGLLPTLEETERFLSDQAPDAMERVVDRLLASPTYGQRWGRHWLDVVRYSDSNGLDENIAHGNAWRYRNYVVAARNADMPYDQFLLIPAISIAGRSPPGCWCLAPRYWRRWMNGRWRWILSTSRSIRSARRSWD
jgi:hypothetical protein